MTAAQIDELINSIGDVIAALSTGALDDKAALYKELGLSLTYHPDTASVYARAELAKPRWAADCVGGGTRTIPPPLTILQTELCLA
jgi:hypothetical protein